MPKTKKDVEKTLKEGRKDELVVGRDLASKGYLREFNGSFVGGFYDDLKTINDAIARKASLVDIGPRLIAVQALVSKANDRHSSTGLDTYVREKRQDAVEDLSFTDKIKLAHSYGDSPQRGKTDKHLTYGMILKTALENFQPGAIELLVVHGWDLNQKIDGKRPLHWAVEQNPPNLELIRELCENGAKLNWEDRDPRYWTTPLRFPVEQGNTELVRVLWEAGAKVVSDDGYLAAKAIEKGDVKMLELLIELAGKEIQASFQAERSLARDFAVKYACSFRENGVTRYMNGVTFYADGLGSAASDIEIWREVDKSRLPADYQRLTSDQVRDLDIAACESMYINTDKLFHTLAEQKYLDQNTVKAMSQLLTQRGGSFQVRKPREVGVDLAEDYAAKEHADLFKTPDRQNRDKISQEKAQERNKKITTFCQEHSTEIKIQDLVRSIEAWDVIYDYKTRSLEALLVEIENLAKTQTNPDAASYSSEQAETIIKKAETLLSEQSRLAKRAEELRAEAKEKITTIEKLKADANSLSSDEVDKLEARKNMLAEHLKVLNSAVSDVNGKVPERVKKLEDIKNQASELISQTTKSSRQSVPDNQRVAKKRKQTPQRRVIKKPDSSPNELENMTKATEEAVKSGDITIALPVIDEQIKGAEQFGNKHQLVKSVIATALKTAATTGDRDFLRAIIVANATTYFDSLVVSHPRNCNIVQMDQKGAHSTSQRYYLGSRKRFCYYLATSEKSLGDWGSVQNHALSYRGLFKLIMGDDFKGDISDVDRNELLYAMSSLMINDARILHFLAGQDTVNQGIVNLLYDLGGELNLSKSSKSSDSTPQKIAAEKGNGNCFNPDKLDKLEEAERVKEKKLTLAQLENQIRPSKQESREVGDKTNQKLSFEAFGSISSSGEQVDNSKQIKQGQPSPLPTCPTSTLPPPPSVRSRSSFSFTASIGSLFGKLAAYVSLLVDTLFGSSSSNSNGSEGSKHTKVDEAKESTFIDRTSSSNLQNLISKTNEKVNGTAEEGAQVSESTLELSTKQSTLLFKQNFLGNRKGISSSQIGVSSHTSSSNTNVQSSAPLRTP